MSYWTTMPYLKHVFQDILMILKQMCVKYAIFDTCHRWHVYFKQLIFIYCNNYDFKHIFLWSEPVHTWRNKCHIHHRQVLTWFIVWLTFFTFGSWYVKNRYQIWRSFVTSECFIDHIIYGWYFPMRKMTILP